ncbi:Flp pilus assembly protein CpaB [Lutimaribacter sp. EGI FJ00014]|uniref:Flp pilus assembly protein CpaB n=1 Tax=Lutimaribacter degradans TaxID=2945989 RepID=A0ACC5ZZ49_9RHOB|nr:Flp pilus assembly protein CpaB [Lutimaribacter sp. EGI FJ00013]MCO0637238.1 Flp pilus assembly protein CpaB [Lutimaribacter sp. EGI FJ00014]
MIGLTTAIWVGLSIWQMDEEVSPVLPEEEAPGLVVPPEPELEPEPEPTPQPEPEPEVARVRILTAARDIAADTPLQPDDFEWTEITEDALAPGMIREDIQPDAITDSAGFVSAVPIAAGDPLTWSALRDPAPETDLSLALSEGNSAMAIAVNAETAAGGLIRPGDRVDVIFLGASGVDGVTEAPRFLAKGVKVLAVDQSTTKIGNQNPANIRILTLELGRDDVISVGQASATGRVAVALRARGDAASPAVVEDRSRTIRVIRQDGIELVEPGN